MKRVKRWICEVKFGARAGSHFVVHGSEAEATKLAERELRGSFFTMRRAGFWDPSRCDIVDEVRRG